MTEDDRTVTDAAESEPAHAGSTSYRVTIRTTCGDLRGTLTTVQPDALLARLNAAARELDGMAMVSPA